MSLLKFCVRRFNRMRGNVTFAESDINPPLGNVSKQGRHVGKKVSIIVIYT